MKTANVIIITAALLGLSGVILGALGSHALANRLAPPLQEAFRTAVLYQQLHAVVLLALGIWGLHTANAWVPRAAAAFVLGLLLFSGCIYLHTLAGVEAVRPITPFGGGLLMIGWALLVPAALARKPA